MGTPGRSRPTRLIYLIGANCVFRPASLSTASLLLTMTKQTRKRSKACNKAKHRLHHKTKHHQRDIDQVHDDLKNPPVLKIDEDLPGRGMYYCISCAKYFINKEAMDKHVLTSVHKRRLKKALENPHTQKDAEAAAEMTAETYPKIDQTGR
eukprot:GDKI01006958.1.p1 GENE.GDKI01006958.1~~GDKI01006958.1.p1  ORF type:complete len:151 (-),score=35.35 GDKI01006958.1:111-563(-)